MTESKHEEYRVFGPPGTGKTTYLASQIGEAVVKHGEYSVIVSSFTRAGAAELVTRGLSVPDSAIATQHGHCYRLLGKPPLAESADGRKEWNQHIDKHDPALHLSGASAVNLDDFHAEESLAATDGDALLDAYNIYRARLTPIEDIDREDVRRFVGYWEQWKTDNDMVDFTDMLTCALEAKRQPEAEIGFFDEVQDNTPLEMAVIRKWARKMRFVILAGDDDQCLYDFKGASADAFLNPPINDAHKRVLRQSYRVPRAVHALAVKWVRQLSHREKKRYLPRDAKGRIRLPAFTMGNQSDIGALVDDVERRLERPNDRGEKRTVMILASCSYQLGGLIAELRQRALLFHNPYRRNRYDWNPVGHAGTAERVRQFLAPGARDEWPHSEKLSFYKALIEQASNPAFVSDLMRASLWTLAEFESWVGLIKRSTVLRRGGMQRIQKAPGHEEHPQFGSVFGDEFTDPASFVLAAHGSMRWLALHCKNEKVEPLRYLRTMIAKRGVDVMNERPRIVVGTIHSVKGGEADSVYVCPDLSVNGWAERERDPDPSIRMAYVAATRAREELVILSPYSTSALPLHNFA